MTELELIDKTLEQIHDIACWLGPDRSEHELDEGLASIISLARYRTIPQPDNLMAKYKSEE